MIAAHQVAYFLRALGDADAGIRAGAVALGLGRQGGAAPVGPLVALCSDPDARVWPPAYYLVRLLPEADAIFVDFLRSTAPAARRGADAAGCGRRCRRGRAAVRPAR